MAKEMERICIDNARAPEKSDGHGFPSWHLRLPPPIGKCWHLRRQMTARKSDGRNVSVSIRSIHCPLNAKSDGLNGFLSSCLSLWERWPSAARTERANNGNVQSEMLAPSQADDVPRAQRFSQSPRVTALPKGEPRHRILAQEMERICIDTLHSLFYGYPSMRVPPESRMVVNGFRPGTLASPCGEVAERSEDGERANNGNVQSENAGTFAADDVPRAQVLSHLW